MVASWQHEIIMPLAMPTRSDDRPMTRNQAAEYLNVHRDTLYKWAVEGWLAYSRLGDGGRAPMRFTKADLDDFIRTNRIPTVEDAAAMRINNRQ